jgi:PAP2 superfamily
VAGTGSVRSTVRRLLRSITPLGWRDLALQIAVFQALGGLYALTGIYGRRQAETAVANSHRILDLEHAMGIDWEGSLQHAVLAGPGLLGDLANGTYFTCQFSISTAFLLWVYARHTTRYPLVRDALVAANVVALLVAIAFPAAPPRLVPGIGLIDTLNADSLNMHSSIVEALNNAYSAVPSLHASYAVVLGVAGVALARRWWVRTIWAAYPALVFYSIVATGNHFVLDAVAGVAALAATPLAAKAWQRAARWWDGPTMRLSRSAATSPPAPWRSRR